MLLFWVVSAKKKRGIFVIVGLFKIFLLTRAQGSQNASGSSKEDLHMKSVGVKNDLIFFGEFLLKKPPNRNGCGVLHLLGLILSWYKVLPNFAVHFLLPDLMLPFEQLHDDRHSLFSQPTRLTSFTYSEVRAARFMKGMFRKALDWAFFSVYLF